MSKTNKKKICIVAYSLAKGGAERSSALLSQMLSHLGHDIHIVTVVSGVDYDYAGTLFNLGELKDKKDTFFSRVKRFLVFKNYLNEHQFDVIIDNRARVQAYREYFVTKLIYKTPTIYVVHSYDIAGTFSSYNWLSRYLYKNEWMTFVSEAAHQKFKKAYGLKRTETIHNGFNFETINTLSGEPLPFENYILFYGRINDKVKNLKLLLDAYQQSKLSEQHIKLILLGDGPDRLMIETYAKQLNIDDQVVFEVFTSNPYPFVKKAKFTMLTSRFEGFPMVIPESLSLGTPVISVDCQSGPNEVIVNGYNGLLVENYNVQALAEAMNSFIFDSDLYANCKANAKRSVEKFSMQNISKDWQNLLNTIDEHQN